MCHVRRSPPRKHIHGRGCAAVPKWRARGACVLKVAHPTGRAAGPACSAGGRHGGAALAAHGSAVAGGGAGHLHAVRAATLERHLLALMAHAAALAPAVRRTAVEQHAARRRPGAGPGGAVARRLPGCACGCGRGARRGGRAWSRVSALGAPCAYPALDGRWIVPPGKNF